MASGGWQCDVDMAELQIMARLDTFTLLCPLSSGNETLRIWVANIRSLNAMNLGECVEYIYLKTRCELELLAQDQNLG
jgi:hypothetical protein